MLVINNKSLKLIFKCLSVSHSDTYLHMSETRDSTTGRLTDNLLPQQRHLKCKHFGAEVSTCSFYLSVHFKSIYF